MRLVAFFFAISASLAYAANRAEAQAIYQQYESETAAPANGAFSPIGYFTGSYAPMYGPNASWGYTGTCCSNVWDGYCDAQHCWRCGEHSGRCGRGCGHGCGRGGDGCCGGGCCQKAGLWRKLMCKRSKLFGSQRSCNCQSGCQQSCCGQSGCAAAMAQPADVFDAEPLMPPPPQPSIEERPYDDAAPADDEAHSHIRKSWTMPRLTSNRTKVHR